MTTEQLGVTGGAATATEAAAGVRRIGQLEVSVAGLGCNNFGRRIDQARAREVVAAALDAGVTMFDTADVYGDGLSEEFLGGALGTQRHNVVITSKFGYAQPPDGLSGGDPRWIPRACEASLRRLGTDHIDLYLLHRPDPVIPVADTLGAMSDLVDQGKVREIGCSNFSASQLSEAASTAEERLRRFVALQNEYSLLQRTPEHGVLQRCSELEMAFIPYSRSPMAC